MPVERPLYLLPYRAAVLALLGVFLLGVAGGTLGAWFTVRRLVRVAPGGERIIERVERVTTGSDEELGSVASGVVSGVVSLLDDREKVVHHGLALTADGIVATSGDLSPRVQSLRRPDGEKVPVSAVRAYADVGLVFLKAEGTYAVPTLERDAPLALGAAGAVVASASERSGYGISVARVSSFRHAADRIHVRYPALARVPVLDRGLPPSLQGAPFVRANGRVAGLVVIESDGTYLLPGPVVDVLLQDYLQHPTETVEGLLSGLRGHWKPGRDQDADASWIVSEVTPASRYAGTLKAGDEILKINGEALDPYLPLLRPLLAAARSRGSVTVDLRRGGATREVTLRPS